MGKKEKSGQGTRSEEKSSTQGCCGSETISEMMSGCCGSMKGDWGIKMKEMMKNFGCGSEKTGTK